MNRPRLLLAAACTLLIALPGLSNPPRRAKSKRPGAATAAEVKEGRQQRADDLHDLGTAANLLQAFKRARQKKDTRALKRIDSEVEQFLRSEAVEQSSEVKSARAEKRRSRQTANRARNGKAARDLHNDKSDARGARNEAGRSNALLARWRAVMGTFDQRTLNEREKILRGMTGLQRQEVRRDQRENKEELRKALGPVGGGRPKVLNKKGQPRALKKNHRQQDKKLRKKARNESRKDARQDTRKERRKNRQGRR